MTLQIGLVGTDGIVLASDRLIAQWEYDSHSLTLSSKLFKTDKMVVCWAGDVVAQIAADKIHNIAWSGDDDIRRRLQECGNEAWRQVHGENNGVSLVGQLPRKVIVAYHDELWQMDVLPVSQVNPVYDSVISGDPKNTARQYINNYVRTYTRPINRPVQHLIFPAAHAVLMAGRENPKGVEGLEVAVIPKARGPLILSRKHEQELEARSKNLSRIIEKHFKQPFDYE